MEPSIGPLGPDVSGRNFPLWHRPMGTAARNRRPAITSEITSEITRRHLLAEVDGGLAIGPTTIGFSIPYPFLAFSLPNTLETL